MSTRALELIEKIFAFYEESTSPEPKEVRSDMLNQILQEIPKMEPGTQEEFEDFVQFFGVQRYGLSGTTQEILQKMHPWQLQIVQQRFRIPSASPDGTPGA